jgi:hypothetical protein
MKAFWIGTLIAAVLVAMTIPLWRTSEDLGNQAPDPQLTGYFKASNSPIVDKAWYDEKSQYDYIFLTPGAWETSGMRGVGDSLKVLNPRINIGSYISIFSLPLWMSRADTTRYPGRKFLYLSDYYAVTTEGDTASNWIKSHVFDIVNPEARAISVREISRYVREQKLGHLMLDYCSSPLPNLLQYQDQWWQDTIHGDLDFDRDGIGHWDDPDEQLMLRGVWAQYMLELRVALPEDCLIIPNGSLAMHSPEFASLVDGLYIEDFPRWHFGSYGYNYENALDPDYAGSLWNYSNPDMWYGDKSVVFLEDRYYQDKLAYVSQCFANTVLLRRYTYDHEEDAPFPMILELGQPTGPATYKDGQIRRYFTEGVLGVDVIDETHIRSYIDRE